MRVHSFMMFFKVLNEILKIDFMKVAKYILQPRCIYIHIYIYLKAHWNKVSKLKTLNVVRQDITLTSCNAIINFRRKSFLNYVSHTRSMLTFKLKQSHTHQKSIPFAGRIHIFKVTYYHALKWHKNLVNKIYRHP